MKTNLFRAVSDGGNFTVVKSLSLLQFLRQNLQLQILDLNFCYHSRWVSFNKFNATSWLLNFEEYATKDVIPTVEAFTSIYRLTVIVFDVYRPISLKTETRSKCGQGARCRVTDKGEISPSLA